MISKVDYRKGIIPDKNIEPLIFIVIISQLFFLTFYQFVVYFTILILIYLFFDLIQHILFKTAKGTIGSGDIKFYLLTYCCFPFYSTIGFLGLPIISIFVLSIFLLFSMMLIKIIMTSLLKTPKFIKGYSNMVQSTNIRFAPVIYFSFIITLLINII